MAENTKMPPNQDQRQRAPQSSDKPQKPAANPSKPSSKPDDSGAADRDRQGVNKPGVNPGKPGIDPDRDRMGNKNPPITEPGKPEKIDLDEVDDDEAATQRVNRE